MNLILLSIIAVVICVLFGFFAIRIDKDLHKREKDIQRQINEMYKSEGFDPPYKE